MTRSVVMQSVVLLYLCMSLNIVTWNIRGIMYGTSELCNYLDTYDIIGITEHWLTNRNNNFMNSIDPRFSLCS